jgi:hypothetical protein
MNKLNDVISNLLDDPSEENKKKYEEYVNKLEYDLLLNNERISAFAVRGECASELLKLWVQKFGSTEGCPASYQDTLNVPFRKIKPL